MGEAAINRLRSGIYLKEGKVSARVKVLRTTRESTRLELTISQGYNRQIRRMCAAVGNEVKRLERVRFGPLRLRGLPRGGFRALTREEVESLERLARGEGGGVGDIQGARTRREESLGGRKRKRS